MSKVDNVVTFSLYEKRITNDCLDSVVVATTLLKLKIFSSSSIDYIDKVMFSFIRVTIDRRIVQ